MGTHHVARIQGGGARRYVTLGAIPLLFQRRRKLRCTHCTHFTCIAICVAALAGCTVPIRSLDKTTKQSDVPSAGEVQTAELGAKLLLQQDVEVARGRKVTQVTRGSMGLFPADFFGMYVLPTMANTLVEPLSFAIC